MSIEKRVGKVWLYFGWNFRRVAFGISVDRYEIALDFLFWYFTIEFWPMFTSND
jgi:hypothetical protein